MDRSSWSDISGDPEIWKKIAIGTSSLVFLLPTPFALGIVNIDLESEAQRLHAKAPPEKNQWLPSVDDLTKLVTGGIGPALVYLSILAMFAMATIPVGLAYFQLFALFRPANELVPEMHAKVSVPIISVLLFALLGLVGMLVQAVLAASFPIALAQYSRGKDLRPALSPVSNAMTVLEMGFSYWLKALGVAAGMFAITVFFITGGFGMGWLLSTLCWIVVNAVFFISLVLASRMALSHIAAELPPSQMAPLPELD